MNLGTTVARIAFLYGLPGQKRITNVRELAEESGASERSIYEHLPAWRQELLELAVNSRETALGLVPTTKDLEALREDCDFMREELDRLKLEIDLMAPTAKGYCAAWRCFATLHRQWREMSGVAAMLDARAAGWKEEARLRAREQVRRAAAEAGREERPARGRDATDDPVFRRLRKDGGEAA